jgi:D-cysteine desulfhydrase
MKIHPQEPDRLHLASLPTPMVQPERLADHWNIDRIYFKRDDLTGLECSGNKIRKLEYVVAAALQSGADTLVSVGGVQSNHCRATAAVAARLGLHCRLLLRTGEAEPATRVGNLLLDELLGADISYHSGEEFNSDRQQLINRVMDLLRADGRQPFFIDMGASIPLGSWGYIRCVGELVDQLASDSPVDLYCATGSSGTQVGLMLGKALFGCDNWTVTGVPVCDDIEYFQREIRQLERATVSEFGLDVSEDMTPINLLDGFMGKGYGIPSAEAIAVIGESARYAGLLLDPVYTSKAMVGVLANIRSGAARRESIPVFIHTGGVFGLMARPELFESAATRR